MSLDVTSYTTNKEVQDIYSAYTDPTTGNVDYEAIELAIKEGDESQFNTEDLLAAYVSGTGGLPDFFMAPEAYLGNPDDYPWLWEDAIVSTLEQLGDLFPAAIDWETTIANFLSYGGVEADANLLSEVDDFVSQYNQSAADAGDSDTEDTFNLFSSSSLKEVMQLFLASGNIGTALKFYTVYGLTPAMRKLEETALDVIDDATDEADDLVDVLEDAGDDPENPSAQYDTQVASQQLGVINNVISTMAQFIQDAQNSISEMMEMSSNLSAQTNRTIQAIIRNIG